MKELFDLRSTLSKEGELDKLANTLDEININEFEKNYGKLFKAGEIVAGQYEVRGFRSGAQGIIYIVWHKVWQMSLAMKTPHRSVWNHSTRRQRYLNEADIWVNLGKHPNIATAYYVRVIDEIPRIFIEYADADSLFENLTEEKINLDWSRLLDIAIQIVNGLLYAHNQGLIHRDLKPANILLWNDGSVKISDFGLTKFISNIDENEAQVNKENSEKALIGTPAYMAPEQWDNSNYISFSTDIYALGIILYELFTNHHPYHEILSNKTKDKINAIRHQHLKINPVALSSLREDVPKEIENIVIQCLAKNEK